MVANITIKERLIEVLNKYGPESFDESETLLRRLLRELPDDTWRTRQYLETGEEDYAVTWPCPRETTRFTSISPGPVSRRRSA